MGIAYSLLLAKEQAKAYSLLLAKEQAKAYKLSQQGKNIGLRLYYHNQLAYLSRSRSNETPNSRNE